MLLCDYKDACAAWDIESKNKKCEGYLAREDNEFNSSIAVVLFCVLIGQEDLQKKKNSLGHICVTLNLCQEEEQSRVTVL